MEKHGLLVRDPASALGLFAGVLAPAGGPIAGPIAGPVAIIPAAGTGSRAGFSRPKQYQRLNGETVLALSIKAISKLSALKAIVVVLSADDQGWEEYGLDEALANIPNVFALPIGGSSRRDSVLAGCHWVSRAVDASVNPWVMVHDAARPMVSTDSLERLWDVCETLLHPMHGAILAVPVADTVKRIKPNAQGVKDASCAVVCETLDRHLLWAAQTPQMFRLRDLITAYEACNHATDEAAAIEASQGVVQLVASETANFKLTQASDFEMMERFMARSTLSIEQTSIPFAIGQGFDVHALVEGRSLIIGGVHIPFEKGLKGHSDADVLLHAITDAVLGAAGLGDIGRLFPDTDMAFKDADSSLLLASAVNRVGQAGWSVGQIDATVIAQAPKISPYAAQMQAVIARACSMPAEMVNVKGKTTENLGFTGRGEGIAAQAVAMLVRRGA